MTTITPIETAEPVLFDDLPGVKYLRYVPNTNHSLAGSDATESTLAFYQAVLKGSPLPQYSWKVQADGSAMYKSTSASPVQETTT